MIINDFYGNAINLGDPVAGLHHPYLRGEVVALDTSPGRILQRVEVEWDNGTTELMSQNAVRRLYKVGALSRDGRIAAAQAALRDGGVRESDTSTTTTSGLEEPPTGTVADQPSTANDVPPWETPHTFVHGGLGSSVICKTCGMSDEHESHTDPLDRSADRLRMATEYIDTTAWAASYVLIKSDALRVRAVEHEVVEWEATFTSEDAIPITPSMAKPIMNIVKAHNGGIEVTPPVTDITKKYLFRQELEKLDCIVIDQLTYRPDDVPLEYVMDANHPMRELAMRSLALGIRPHLFDHDPDDDPRICKCGWKRDDVIHQVNRPTHG